MRVERIRLQTIRLPLREPFRISSGVTHHRRILLVRMEFDGVEGIGECVAGEAPFYSPETVDTARHVIEAYLGPAVLGTDITGPGQVARRLDEAARGHRMAKAALEMAAWDALARARDLPLATLLGGSGATVPAGVSIGIQTDTGALLERVAAFLDQGYRRIKLKISPGHDVAVVEAVRSHYPDAPLTVDANAAYGAGDHEPFLALDDLGLAYIEQPYHADGLLPHAALHASLRTPVCLDESITGPERCADALGLDACGVVNIKPGRMGGHGASVRVHDLCAEADVPVWCGGMLESGVGRAHNVALASLPNMRLPGDTSASDRYWERDVVDPAFALNPDGTVDVPTGPGIGVELDEEFLTAIETDRVELRPGG